VDAPIRSNGCLAFITAAIAAGVGLRQRARAPLAVAALLGLSGSLIIAHPPPFGPTGLARFIAAVLPGALRVLTPARPCRDWIG